MKAHRCFTAAVLLLGFAHWSPSQYTHAQSTLDDVHIAAEVGAPSAATGAFRGTPGAVIRRDVKLVLVPVTITDTRDRLVNGLGKDNFQLFDEKKRQEITQFSDEDTAVSVGVLLDLSGSMADKIESAREALVDFCRVTNPQDELFLITFSDRVEMVNDFTTQVEEIQSRLPALAPKGHTALLDAVYLGLTHMRQARYGRRALFIISDGGDNHSRYTEGEVKSLAKEADVAIYTIGIFDRYLPTAEEVAGPSLLSSLSEVTGGFSSFVENPNVLPAVAERISTELRRQYLLAYHPQNTADGKWHRIRIKLKLPSGLPPLLVRAKAGYYAPSR